METVENMGTKKVKKSNRTGLNVAAGVLAGAAAGAIAGVLLAPDSGKNTRKKIADGTKKMVDDVKAKATDSLKMATESVKNVSTKINRKAEMLEENLN